MRATVESHHSVAVYISSFPALLWMTMELGNKYDYIDSLRELLLALHAYFGIHTWLILWPLWLWLVKKKKDWICSLFSGGWVWTHYTKSWCGITLMISVDLMLQFWSFASSVQDTPGTYITHSATRPLSDITGGKFIRFHAALSGATKWIYTSISRHSAALSVTRKHTLMCKNGAVTL